jgi:hypothetical protein
MVRPTESDGDETEGVTNSNSGLPEDSQSKTAFDRRDCLKLGSAAMGAALGGSIVGSASAAEYDTITLDDGEKREVRLGDGDTFANKLIDQRADQAALSIRARGDGWTIKNLGFLGAAEWDEYNFHIHVGCPNGGSGVVENVYANNKRSPNDSMGFLWEYNDHSGHIQMRHTYVEGFGNNAGYCTNANKRSRAGGTVTYERCYHADNTPSNFRPGGEGSAIRDCVSVIDDPDLDRGTYPNTNSHNIRGFHPRHTPGIAIENCSFYLNPKTPEVFGQFGLVYDSISNGDYVESTARNCSGNLSTDHELFEFHNDRSDQSGQNIYFNLEDYEQGTQTVGVLGDGVPTSPEMAARGERELPPELPGSDDSVPQDGPSLERTLTIDGQDTSRTNYEFTVSGDITDDSNTGTFDDADEIEGSSVVGFVNGGVDGYRFSGKITEAVVDGDATVLVDGEEVSYGNPTNEKHDLEIRTEDDTDWMDYSVTTSGKLTKATYANDKESITQNDDGTWTATGTVGQGGQDSFIFTGSIEDWNAEFDQDAYTVLVDGEEVSYGNPTNEKHDLEIRTEDDTDWMDYSVTTSGKLTKATYANDKESITQNDDGTWTATGTVGQGGQDSFIFTGSIEDWNAEFDQDAYTVLVDGSEVTDSEFL